MEVIILATKSCNHRPILEQRLNELDIPYQVQYFDDEPELIEKYDLHLSPNLVVDGKIVFRAESNKRLPKKADLERYVGK